MTAEKAFFWITLILGFCIGFSLASAVAHAEPGMNMSPMYSHPAPGTHDPYPRECCSGQDCSPWPSEDVVPEKNGGYRIPSLNVSVPAWKVHPVTPPMAALAQAQGADGQYHLCANRNGPKTVVYCLFRAEGF